MKQAAPRPTRPFLILSLLMGAALSAGCGGGGGQDHDQGGGNQAPTDAVWDQFDWDEADWS